MADSTIPNLTAVTTPVTTDEFACRQSGDTRDKKQTRVQLHTLEVGEQILAPVDNDASSPSFAVGSGNDGFYSNVDGQIKIAIAGVARFTIGQGAINSDVVDGFYLLGSASTATAPAHSFNQDTNSGLGRAGADAPCIVAGGHQAFTCTEASGLLTFDFDAGDNATGNVGSLTSIKSAVATLTAATGTELTSSSLIPDGAILLGITSRVTTEFGTGNSMTGITLGISGGDTDIWGTLSALTAGATSDPTTAGWTTVFERHIAATDVTATAVGGTGYEDGVGVLEVVVHYIDLTAPTG